MYHRCNMYMFIYGSHLLCKLTVRLDTTNSWCPFLVILSGLLDWLTLRTNQTICSLTYFHNETYSET